MDKNIQSGATGISISFQPIGNYLLPAFTIGGIIYFS
jgi:hypothetical protein